MQFVEYCNSAIRGACQEWAINNLAFDKNFNNTANVACVVGNYKTIIISIACSLYDLFSDNL